MDLPDPSVIPDTSLLVTSDDTPVDNRHIEKLQRLLADSLTNSWQAPGGKPFEAMVNVGLFYTPAPAIVPDLMVCIDMPKANLEEPDHRSFFVWIVGKVPDLIVEMVSDKRGGEDGEKMKKYARFGVRYYVIYDPQNHLEGGVLRVFELTVNGYKSIDPTWIEPLGLGLTFHFGEFEGFEREWLRWCDKDGHVLLTGGERAQIAEEDVEREKQNAEREKADRLIAEAEVARLKAELALLKGTSK